MALPSRRTFNNIVIIGVLVFIALINLPVYLRSQLAENDPTPLPNQNPTQKVIALFPADVEVKSLQFSDVTLIKGTPWQANAPLTVSATELANRWLNLSGTEVNAETFQKLAPSLPKQSTLVVEHMQNDSPLQIDYYQLPSFWLLRNGENRWIAVSVDSQYLFPFHPKDQ